MFESIQSTQSDDHAEIVPLNSRPGFLIRRLNQIHHALFAEQFGTFKITPVQYGVLSKLIESPGSDQADLAFETGLDRANIADVLRRLESRNLVMRQPDPSDKRAKQAFLTAEGESITNAMYRPMLKAQEQLLAGLDSDDQARLLELLRTLVNNNNGFARTSMRML